MRRSGTFPSGNLAEYSTRWPSAQYFRANIQPNYHEGHAGGLLRRALPARPWGRTDGSQPNQAAWFTGEALLPCSGDFLNIDTVRDLKVSPIRVAPLLMYAWKKPLPPRELVCCLYRSLPQLPFLRFTIPVLFGAQLCRDPPAQQGSSRVEQDVSSEGADVCWHSERLVQRNSLFPAPSLVVDGKVERIAVRARLGKLIDNFQTLEGDGEAHKMVKQLPQIGSIADALGGWPSGCVLLR